MSKTQTMTFSKEGSNWANATAALTELASDMETLEYSVELKNPNNETITLDGQTLIQTSSWTDDTDFESYKNAISDYEDTVDEFLSAAGWTITETIADE